MKNNIHSNSSDNNGSGNTNNNHLNKFQLLGIRRK